VVTEPSGGAHKDPGAAGLKRAIGESLEALSRKSVDVLLSERQAKFLSMGVFGENEMQKKSFLQKLRDFF